MDGVVDWAGGFHAPLFFRLQLQSNSTQTLTLYSKTNDTANVALFQCPNLSTGLVTIRTQMRRFKRSHERDHRGGPLRAAISEAARVERGRFEAATGSAVQISEVTEPRSHTRRQP